MNNIYVENYNLPESCWKCECLKDGDETGFYCSLSAFDNDEDYREVDVRHPKCPLKSISTKLAEERKKVLWEIRKRAKRTQIYIKPTEKSPTGKEKCFVYEVSDDFLDQIERNEQCENQ